MKTIIEVKSHAVMNALLGLKSKIGDISPVLATIGEDIVERSKQRFSTTTGPDGAKWRPNTQVTLINYIRSRGGLNKKTGKIGVRGTRLAISKRPLQGKSGDLAKRLFYAVSKSGESMTVNSSMDYAAMQQFGGKKSMFPQLWGDIPARPFLPIMPNAELYPAEQDLILEGIRSYLGEWA